MNRPSLHIAAAVVRARCARAACIGIGLLACGHLLPGASLWAQDAAPRCGENEIIRSISLEDWESGLGDWTVDTYEVANPATFDTPDWAVEGSLPDGRTGVAAYVPNLDIGDCGDDDESGVLTLTSPAIEIPAGSGAIRVSINHWYQTEFGWDGGNLRLSVNDGPFEAVPGSAFEFGSYSGTLFDALDEFGFPNNTNPLAEQDAFTGPESDPGAWIESRLDLDGLAAAGDSLRLRFDFGVDACFGDRGWYVDEVEVYGCSAESPDGTSLTLIKQVINDDGGTAQPSDWALQASGPTTFSGAGPEVSSPPDFQAGTYDLNEAGGPPNYRASAWDCEGGTQMAADVITLAPGESAVCTITNDDLDPDFEINAGHAGAWFNPETSGQGLFVDVEPEQQFLFLAWFTFTEAGAADPNQQRWLTAQGNYSGNLAELVLYETLGGRFDDPQAVQTLEVGTVSLLFGDCDFGQMAYRIDTEGLEGAFPLERVIPGSGQTCAQLGGDATEAVDINAGMDGSWFEAATSGQGFLVDADPDPEGGGFIFMSWFTYGEDTASGQRWLTAQGSFEGALAEIPVNETTGGSFDAPGGVQTMEVGSIGVEFSDCANAVLVYSLPGDGLAGEIELTRVVPGGEALCESIAGVE